MQAIPAGNGVGGVPGAHVPPASGTVPSAVSATVPTASDAPVSDQSDTGGVRRESMAEVGCLLGSFRDVAHSIGLNVTAVHLTTRASDQPVWTSLPLTDRPPPRANVPVDPSASRARVKFLPLLHVFCDCMLLAGYTVTHVDTVDCPPAVLGVSKQWKMEVCISQLQNAP